MIIDFTNRLTEAKVQEMIDVSMMSFTGYTGVINLSTASAAEVKKAFEEPDKWLTSINYSGETYLEHHRRAIRGGEEYDIYYYVVGASADTLVRRIYDRVKYVELDPATGEILHTDESDYVPDVIYDLDRMNANQLLVVRDRAIRQVIATRNNQHRFSAVWRVGERFYMACARGFGKDSMVWLLGMTAATVAPNLTVYYDLIYIDSQGTLTHNEYTCNTVFTPLV